MLVKDLLEEKGREVVTITPDADILSAMKRLIDRKISCLPVVNDDDEVLGIVSDKDIFLTVFSNQDNYSHMTVGDIMTTELIIGVESDSIDYISGLMTRNRIRHVPVMERARLVGLISVGDVVKSQVKDIVVENRYLRQYIAGGYPG